MNTGLQIFVIVMPNESLASTSPAKPYFQYDTDNSIVCVILEEGFAGPVPGKPSFWYKVNKDLDLCFCVTYLILLVEADLGTIERFGSPRSCT